MCFLCTKDFAAYQDATRRLRVLEMLALIEHPDALSPDAALHLSREIMGIIGPHAEPLRCESLSCDAVAGENR